MSYAVCKVVNEGETYVLSGELIQGGKRIRGIKATHQTLPVAQVLATFPTLTAYKDVKRATRDFEKLRAQVS